MKLREEIIEVLKEIGFESVDDTWEKESVIQQPGQVIIINGQRIQQPGTEIRIKHKIELMGEGSVENIDGTEQSSFELINIRVFQNDSLAEEVCCSVYDIDEFKTKFVN